MPSLISEKRDTPARLAADDYTGAERRRHMNDRLDRDEAVRRYASGLQRINSVDFTREHVTNAVKVGVEEFERLLLANIISRTDRSESPLETAFAAWWLAYELAWGAVGFLLPQQEVECEGQKYRTDFTVVPETRLMLDAQRVGLQVAEVAIELDGHEFHERTKEQVEWRNRRDRALAASGWLVLHFSGAEFNRDPAGCVKSARQQIRDRFEQLEHRIAEVRMATKYVDVALTPRTDSRADR